MRERFGGDVEAEPDQDDGNRYQFWVFSPQFKEMSHLQRQDALWKLVEQELSREEQLDVAMIWTFAPGEIDEFIEGVSA
jgi:hypothetical protein